MKVIYFQNHVLTLTFDRELRTAFAVWVGFLNSQEFQEATTKCLDLIFKEGLTHWLADNRKMKAIRQADQQWFLENVLPKLLESPLQRMSTLVSEDIFNKMAVEQMIQKATALEDTLAMQDFDDESAALTWLGVSATPMEMKSSGN